jgi:D-alanyl-D-alanine carboxypeptidase
MAGQFIKRFMPMQSSSALRPRPALNVRLLQALLVAGLVISAAQPAVTFADASRMVPATVAMEGDIARQIDTTLAATFKPDEPGAAVIVVKDGKTILRKAYGLADVEKKVAVQPGDVFRIGSITKQFTAVAILMLEEEGKLSVKDEITKFLPDYPTQGKKITIEHLLTHTSGIRSYTSMPTFRDIVAKDMKPMEVVDFFKNEKMDFDPGERYLYNNSGYFLLGVIIEKISGMSYADFVAKRIFVPLDMKHTAYEGSERNGVKRVAGHQRRAEAWVPAQPMSMTQPYAAGSLISNVDDMATWNAAVEAGKLLKPATWKRAFTPYVLNNGKPMEYGYGWSLRKFRGQPIIEHGGAINGFVSEGMRVPDSKVFVSILMNHTGRQPGPSYIAQNVTAMAMGKPFAERKPITVSVDTLKAFEGIYKTETPPNRVVQLDGDKLVLQRGGTRAVMVPYAENEFALPNFSFTRYRFVKGEDGKVKHVVAIDPNDSEDINVRIGDKPTERKVVPIAQKDFDMLVGEYKIANDFALNVTREGDRYFTQATGQGKIEIYAESETKFFVKVMDAQLTFQKDAEGKATGVVMTQGGRDTPAKKVK